MWTEQSRRGVKQPYYQALLIYSKQEVPIAFNNPLGRAQSFNQMKNLKKFHSFRDAFHYITEVPQIES
jgi:hypothetical protein